MYSGLVIRSLFAVLDTHKLTIRDGNAQSVLNVYSGLTMMEKSIYRVRRPR